MRRAGSWCWRGRGWHRAERKGDPEPSIGGSWEGAGSWWAFEGRSCMRHVGEKLHSGPRAGQRVLSWAHPPEVPQILSRAVGGPILLGPGPFAHPAPRPRLSGPCLPQELHKPPTLSAPFHPLILKADATASRQQHGGPCGCHPRPQRTGLKRGTAPQICRTRVQPPLPWPRPRCPSPHSGNTAKAGGGKGQVRPPAPWMPASL